jgi:hypothetical protein
VLYVSPGPTFLTGLAARRRVTLPPAATADPGSSSLVSDSLVAFTCGKSLFVYRSVGPAASSPVLVQCTHESALTTCSLHPSDGSISTGDAFGRLRTWFLPAALPGYVPPKRAQPSDQDKALVAMQAQLQAMAAEGRNPAAGERGVIHLAIADSAAATALTPVSVQCPSSSVHWHAHAVVGACYMPDGSYLVSGGEEAVAVLWRLPVLPPSAVAAPMVSGPSKDKKLMTFLPRLGAPIRCVSAFAKGAAEVPFHYGAAPDAASPVEAEDAEAEAEARAAGPGGSHIREAPPLMLAVSCTDNSVLLLNAVSLREMWRLRGLAIGGLAAVPTTGVVNFLSRAYMRKLQQQQDQQKSGALGVSGGRAVLSLCDGTDGVQIADSHPQACADVGALLNATCRYLVKGLAVDPRTRSVVVNGLPGRASLQWVDVRKSKDVRLVTTGGGADGSELEVAPRNLVSRKDEDAPAPVRVTHVAFSHDGLTMATVEVQPPLTGMAAVNASAAAAATSASTEGPSTLKFWSWSAVQGRFVLNTRVDGPHKASITALEYHPSSRLVLTASSDRTFKLWEETTALPVPETIKAAQGGANGTAAASKKGKKDDREEDRAATLADPLLVWQCRSVGFYRDFPASAAAFSGDGTCLAVGYSNLLTLWDWRDNSLRRVMSRTAHAGSSGDASLHITGLAFLGVSPYLVSTTAASIDLWDVLSCSLLWSYAGAVPVSLAADKVGLSTSNRFAVVARLPGQKLPSLKKGTTKPAQQQQALVPITETAGDHFALVFDAPSSTPITCVRLPEPEAPEFNHFSASMLPWAARAPLHAVAFLPPARASGPNDVVVLGPRNEFIRVETGRNLSVAASTPGAADVSARVRAAAAPAGPAGLALLRNTEQSEASRAPATPAGLSANGAIGAAADRQFSTLIASLGPTQALLGTSSSLYESLIGALLPAAPTTQEALASTSAAGALSGRKRRLSESQSQHASGSQLVAPTASTVPRREESASNMAALVASSAAALSGDAAGKKSNVFESFVPQALKGLFRSKESQAPVAPSSDVAERQIKRGRKDVTDNSRPADTDESFSSPIASQSSVKTAATPKGSVKVSTQPGSGKSFRTAAYVSDSEKPVAKATPSGGQNRKQAPKASHK